MGHVQPEAMMQKWEYLLMKHTGDDYWLYYPNGQKEQLKPSTLAFVLNRLGTESWEAVNHHTWVPLSSYKDWPEGKGHTPHTREILFKRPIEE